MQTTTNFGLKKPEGTDYINVNDLNENADKIDTELKSHADSIAEIGTHLADYTQHVEDESAHGIGNKSLLETTEKATIVGAVNELFTNVSDGKSLVGGAITGIDNSVVIPTDPTFGDLASAIGGISTGKKWASGSGVFGSNKIAEVRGLAFSPKLIIINSSGTIGSGRVVYMHGHDATKNRTSYSVSQISFVSSWEVFTDGFKIVIDWAYHGGNYSWVAYE